MDQYRIRIADDDELVAVREAVEAAAHASDQPVTVEEVTEPPVPGEPERLVGAVTAVLVGAAVVALSHVVYEWWKKTRGGLVIDLRPGAADMFSRDRDLEFGYVATIAEDGTVTLDVKDVPDRSAEWVTKVIELVGKPASAVADAAKKIVGEQKVSVTSATG